tara:strand:- start:52360 stop:52731 length:372 start_codon:yes stop_codon:yes gene_type:complete
MKKVLTSIFLFVFLFQGCIKSKSTEIETVTVEELNTHIQYASLPQTEIKGKEDFKTSHLVNASNVIDNEDFRTNLKSLDMELPIAIYFTTDNNTAKAASILNEMGFKQIYILDGGIKKWNPDN